MRTSTSYHDKAWRMTGSVYNRVLVASTGILAVGTGALTAISPRFEGVSAGAVVALWMIIQRQRLVTLFPRILALLLLGYMFLGKGFAYIGVQPVYVGEVVLAIATLTILLTACRAQISILHLLLLAFMVLAFIDTVPYIASDGLNTVRDAVL